MDLALGLIAVYVTAVNALTHSASAAGARRYTPGLVTAVVLFVPVSAWGTYEVIAAADPGAGSQALAIAIAVGLHAALIALVVSRLVRLRRATPASVAR